MTELEQTLLNSLRALDAERESAQARINAMQKQIDQQAESLRLQGLSLEQLTKSQDDLAEQLTSWLSVSKR